MWIDFWSSFQVIPQKVSQKYVGFFRQSFDLLEFLLLKYTSKLQKYLHDHKVTNGYTFRNCILRASRPIQYFPGQFGGELIWRQLISCPNCTH